jgi:hypothetical protein
MLKGFAIVSGVAITSILAVAAAYADCKHNISQCDEVVVYACCAAITRKSDPAAIDAKEEAANYDGLSAMERN